MGVFNDCFRAGVFPARWKRTCLVLLPKPGKSEGLPSSYRPLCLLDDVGKILESILVRKMEQHIPEKNAELS